MMGLAEKRVLIVEDEALIGTMIADWLDELGCHAIGPATRVAHGFALAEAEQIDAAILDVNVASEPVYPLADYLRQRNVSIIFATGYGQTTSNAAYDAPVLEKPFTLEQLARALKEARIK